MVELPAADADAAERHAARPRRALVGGLTASIAILLAAGVAPAGALDRLPGPWRQATATAPAAVAVDDDTTCTAPAAPATTLPTASGSSLSQTVTVVVPPIVRVVGSDDGGLTITTNAARPPAEADLVWVRQVDDSYLPADAAMVQRVLTATWDDTPWCSTTAEHTSVG